MYLGFDTSNYTTSVCAYGEAGVTSRRRIIPVRDGERGIRQSDGVFEHLRTLPALYDELDIRNVKAVGVSTKPRNIKDSYMPVFLAGQGYARVAAKSLGVPLYEFSHQDGHIAAGILSGKHTELLSGEFLAVHISGGTTELLKCSFNGYNFNEQIIGGTRDISAGQLIDRAGVYMGMRFPAGKQLEECAVHSDKALKLPVSTDGAWMNFSGTENRIKEYLKTENKSDISKSVLEAVKNTLVKSINAAISAENADRVLIVGGVASNEYIRCGLEQCVNAQVYFASKEYSSDNAAGIAYLAYLNHEKDR